VFSLQAGLVRVCVADGDEDDEDGVYHVIVVVSV